MTGGLAGRAWAFAKSLPAPALTCTKKGAGGGVIQERMEEEKERKRKEKGERKRETIRRKGKQHFIALLLRTMHCVWCFTYFIAQLQTQLQVEATSLVRRPPSPDSMLPLSTCWVLTDQPLSCCKDARSDPFSTALTLPGVSLCRNQSWFVPLSPQSPAPC